MNWGNEREKTSRGSGTSLEDNFMLVLMRRGGRRVYGRKAGNQHRKKAFLRLYQRQDQSSAASSEKTRGKLNVEREARHSQKDQNREA